MKRVISTKIFQNVKKINYFQRIYVKYWNNIKLFKDKENLLLWNNIYILFKNSILPLSSFLNEE